MTDLADLDTPCLLLDRTRLDRNVARVNARLAALGVTPRPHQKTGKSIHVARRAMATPTGPATVSTLAEAEHLAAHGVTDILYAVGIAPGKLDRVTRIRAGGCDLMLCVDSVEAARRTAAHAARTGDAIPVFVEIDSDGLRAGLPPDHPDVIAVARALVDGGAALAGVMTHFGGSYAGRSPEDFAAMAETERAAAVLAADRLRAAGFVVPRVSVGSTPTALFARDLTGITEARPGVCLIQDLVMAGIGVCTPDDVALSVLATVIGHQREKGWILVDAGWMAMSRDRGTARLAVDQGYGMVCDLDGRPYADLIVTDANQEHGIVARRPGSPGPVPDLPVGARVRILPNHACATAAQHGAYRVLDGGRTVVAIWERTNGW
ncbi:MAG: alanine racemase [Rhodospirillales bacterium]|jgi:D-serine deaminase-like pyridoxal phosphate-dependent protein